MRILSIDIGVHNMAFYIEEFDPTKLTCLKFSRSARYTAELKTCTPEFKIWQDKVFQNGTTIYLEKCNLSPDKGNLFNLHTFINLTSHLDGMIDFIQICDIIVIEMQLNKNPMCMRLEQHIISWITFQFLDNKEIVVFGASNKTRVIGCPSKIMSVKKKRWIKTTKSYYKKWSCTIADHIMTLRNDIPTHDFIFQKNKSKADDLSDVVVQLQAFKIKRYVDGLSR